MLLLTSPHTYLLFLCQHHYTPDSPGQHLAAYLFLAQHEGVVDCSVITGSCVMPLVSVSYFAGVARALESA